MNKSSFLLFRANAYAEWAYEVCLFILIADFVFVIAFLVSFSRFEYIVLDIVAKDNFSIIFIIINTFFVFQSLNYFLFYILDIDFFVFWKLSEAVSDSININFNNRYVIKALYEKFIKFKTFTFRDIIGLIYIFYFSVSVAGGLHIIITFVLWLIIDIFNCQITFLSNLQHWVYHHYPLLCLYVFGYVLSLYAIKIYYLWKTDSDLKKFLEIFQSWKKILKEHNPG